MKAKILSVGLSLDGSKFEVSVKFPNATRVVESADKTKTVSEQIVTFSITADEYQAWIPATGEKTVENFLLEKYFKPTYNKLSQISLKDLAGREYNW